MIARYFKRVSANDKIHIPLLVRQIFGRDFWMEIYEDKIILIPTKKVDKNKKI